MSYALCEHCEVAEALFECDECGASIGQTKPVLFCEQCGLQAHRPPLPDHKDGFHKLTASEPQTPEAAVLGPCCQLCAADKKLTVAATLFCSSCNVNVCDTCDQKLVHRGLLARHTRSAIAAPDSSSQQEEHHWQVFGFLLKSFYPALQQYTRKYAERCHKQFFAGYKKCACGLDFVESDFSWHTVKKEYQPMMTPGGVQKRHNKRLSEKCTCSRLATVARRNLAPFKPPGPGPEDLNQNHFAEFKKWSTDPFQWALVSCHSVVPVNNSLQFYCGRALRKDRPTAWEAFDMTLAVAFLENCQAPPTLAPSTSIRNNLRECRNEWAHSPSQRMKEATFDKFLTYLCDFLSQSDVATHKLLPAAQLRDMVTSGVHLSEADISGLKNEAERIRDENARDLAQMGEKVASMGEQVASLTDAVKDMDQNLTRIALLAKPPLTDVDSVPVERMSSDVELTKREHDAFLGMQEGLDLKNAQDHRYILLTNFCKPALRTNFLQLATVPWDVVFDISQGPIHEGLYAQFKEASGRSVDLIKTEQSALSHAALAQKMFSGNDNRVVYAVLKPETIEARLQSYLEWLDKGHDAFMIKLVEVVQQRFSQIPKRAPSVFVTVLNTDHSLNEMQDTVSAIRRILGLRNEWAEHVLLFRPADAGNKAEFGPGCFSESQTFEFPSELLRAMVDDQTAHQRSIDAAFDFPVYETARGLVTLEEWHSWLRCVIPVEKVAVNLQGDARSQFEYYQGATVGWENIASGHAIVRRNITSKLTTLGATDVVDTDTLVTHLITTLSKPNRKWKDIQLYHTPSAGGTTLAYQLLFRVYHRHPCVVVKGGCEVETIAETLMDIRTKFGKTLLVLVEDDADLMQQIRKAVNHHSEHNPRYWGHFLLLGTVRTAVSPASEHHGGEQRSWALSRSWVHLGSLSEMEKRELREKQEQVLKSLDTSGPLMQRRKKLLESSADTDEMIFFGVASMLDEKDSFRRVLQHVRCLLELLKSDPRWQESGQEFQTLLAMCALARCHLAGGAIPITVIRRVLPSYQDRGTQAPRLDTLPDSVSLLLKEKPMHFGPSKTKQTAWTVPSDIGARICLEELMREHWARSEQNWRHGILDFCKQVFIANVVGLEDEKDLTIFIHELLRRRQIEFTPSVDARLSTRRSEFSSLITDANSNLGIQVSVDLLKVVNKSQFLRDPCFLELQGRLILCRLKGAAPGEKIEIMDEADKVLADARQMVEMSGYEHHQTHVYNTLGNAFKKRMTFHIDQFVGRFCRSNPSDLNEESKHELFSQLPEMQDFIEAFLIPGEDALEMFDIAMKSDKNRPGTSSVLCREEGLEDDGFGTTFLVEGDNRGLRNMYPCCGWAGAAMSLLAAIKHLRDTFNLTIPKFSQVVDSHCQGDIGELKPISIRDLVGLEEYLLRSVLAMLPELESYIGRFDKRQGDNAFDDTSRHYLRQIWEHFFKVYDPDIFIAWIEEDLAQSKSSFPKPLLHTIRCALLEPPRRESADYDHFELMRAPQRVKLCSSAKEIADMVCDAPSARQDYGVDELILRLIRASRYLGPQEQGELGIDPKSLQTIVYRWAQLRHPKYGEASPEALYYRYVFSFPWPEGTLDITPASTLDLDQYGSEANRLARKLMKSRDAGDHFMQRCHEFVGNQTGLRALVRPEALGSVPESDEDTETAFWEGASALLKRLEAEVDEISSSTKGFLRYRGVKIFFVPRMANINIEESFKEGLYVSFFLGFTFRGPRAFFPQRADESSHPRSTRTALHQQATTLNMLQLAIDRAPPESIGEEVKQVVTPQDRTESWFPKEMACAIVSKCFEKNDPNWIEQYLTGDPPYLVQVAKRTIGHGVLVLRALEETCRSTNWKFFPELYKIFTGRVVLSTSVASYEQDALQRPDVRERLQAMNCPPLQKQQWSGFVFSLDQQNVLVKVLGHQRLVRFFREHEVDVEMFDSVVFEVFNDQKQVASGKNGSLRKVCTVEHTPVHCRVLKELVQTGDWARWVDPETYGLVEILETKQRAHFHNTPTCARSKLPCGATATAQLVEVRDDQAESFYVTNFEDIDLPTQQQWRCCLLEQNKQNRLFLLHQSAKQQELRLEIPAAVVARMKLENCDVLAVLFEANGAPVSPWRIHKLSANYHGLSSPTALILHNLNKCRFRACDDPNCTRAHPDRGGDENRMMQPWEWLASFMADRLRQLRDKSEAEVPKIEEELETLRLRIDGLTGQTEQLNTELRRFGSVARLSNHDKKNREQVKQRRDKLGVELVQLEQRKQLLQTNLKVARGRMDELKIVQ